MTTYIILSVLLLFALTIIAIIKFNPAFGARQPREKILSRATLPNHDGKSFKNIHSNIKETFKAEDYSKLLSSLLKRNPHRKPSQPLPVKKWSKESLVKLPDDCTTAIWLGHSALFIKINGQNILIDPMLSYSPSPVKGVVGQRFNKELPIDIQDFPELDLILLTHDHYDHLDFKSIKKLKPKTKAFLCPTGVGEHLIKWGVEKDNITELYWEESFNVGGIKITSMPAQHFSGRGPRDRMHTLWCSYVIDSGHEKIFFSGDSGYFDGFKKIGEQHGPFDICFMECGQYNELWPDMHMFPEQTAQAFMDVKGQLLVPIHWGAFPLSDHDWDDPVKRIKAASLALNIDLHIPQLGETILLDNKITA